MTEEYDAFTGGVDFGGMRTKNDVRILLCYILNSLDAPFSKTALNEALQRTSLANFFEINDALSALKDAGLLTVCLQDNDEYYILTPSGKDVAERLETDLPMSVRETAVAAALELFAKDKARAGADVQIEKLPKEYHVKMSVKDGDTLMMQTVLYVSDSLQADKIGENFLLHPEKLYGGIVDTLTTED